MELWVLRFGPVPFYNSQLCYCFEWVFALALSLSIYHISGIEGRIHLHSEYTQGVYLSLTKRQTTDVLLPFTFNQLFFQCFM